MTDDKWFQILMFAEMFKRASNKLHENVWTQVHESFEKSHVTWLFSLIVLDLWTVVFRCSAAIAL